MGVVPAVIMRQRTGEIQNSLFLVVLGVLIIALCVLRIFSADTQGLWLDELYTLSLINGFDPYLFPGSDLTEETATLMARQFLEAVSSGDFFANFARNIEHEGHPPLYYLLVKGWAAVFGYSAGALRSFSIFTSIITIPLVYLISRIYTDRMTSLFACALFVALPVQLYYSVEARAYSLTVFLAALATFFLFKMVEQRGDSRFAVFGWVIAGFLAMMSHYYAVLYLSALASVVVFEGSRAREMRVLSMRTVYLFLPQLLFLGWVPMLVRQMQVHGGSHWTQGRLNLWDSVLSVPASIKELVIGPAILPTTFATVLATLLIILGLALLYFKKPPKSKTIDRILFFSILLFYLGIIALDFLLDKKTITVSRYAIYCCLPISLLVARAMFLGRFRKIVGVAVVILLSSISVSVAKGDMSPKQMVREAVQFVESRRREEAAVIVTPSGPLLVGFSIYGYGDTPVAGVTAEGIDTRISSLMRDGYEEIWVIEQRLGLDSEAWALPDRRPPVETVRFVGIDVKKYVR